jgi:DUF4097 and DUF4098 domain-containing protein YvlB
MKRTLTALMLLTAVVCSAQTFSEKIVREFSFEKKGPDNALIVANINGDITVTGYSGDKILLEITKTIKGKTPERTEKGKQEIQLGVIDRADTLIFYVDGGCNKFGRTSDWRDDDGNDRNNGRDQWGYNWNNCNSDRCRTSYDYTMDFTLKVPFSLHVSVSTINDGDISIQGVNGAVSADNINGSIKLANLSRETRASTINGDVDIEYDQNPKQACRFYTLNGDINAMFQKGLAANLTFESFNGEFYTNIDKIESLPVKVEKMEKEGDGIKFKVNGNRYKVGSGGALLDFETFNGNVYLKEKSN